MECDAVVYVVDDQDEVREAIRWLLESVGLRAHTCRSGEEFLASWDQRRPACAILDIRMPHMGGFEVHAHLAGYGDMLPVIVLTGHADVPMVLRAMKSGVFDFFQKPFNDQELLDAVQRAVAVSRARFQARTLMMETRCRVEALTEREREVLEHLLAGESNKEVARALNLSPRTVEAHRAHILQKLQVRSLVELMPLLSHPAGGVALFPAATDPLGPDIRNPTYVGSAIVAGHTVQMRGRSV